MKKVFVIQTGKDLFVKGKLYSLYQSTTKNILEATLFSTEEEAQKIAKNAVNAKIVSYFFVSEEETNREIDLLRVELEQVKRDRDDLLKLIVSQKKSQGEN